MSLTALTERVHSDEAIPPGRKYFLLMERTQVLIEVGRHISIAQNIPISTVHRICCLPVTPQKFRSGRKKIINTPTWKYFVSIATQDAYHRRLAYSEVAKIAGVQACEKTLRAAFAAEGYGCRSAPKKPYLTVTTKLKRLRFAEEHQHWAQDMWRR